MNQVTFYRRKEVSMLIIIMSLFVSLSLYNCGSGGSGSSTSSNSPGNSATLTWDAPTTHVDGTPLTDLAGYRIYYSMESGKFNSQNSITVGKDVTTYALENLRFSPGTYYFTVTAYDTDKIESDFSNEVSKTIN